MTVAGMFHQKGNVDCLYLRRKDGGRGTISVEDFVKVEEKNLARYIMRSEERLFGRLMRVWKWKSVVKNTRNR